MVHQALELVLEDIGDAVKTEFEPMSPSNVSTTSGSVESQEPQDAKIFDFQTKSWVSLQDDTTSLRPLVDSPLIVAGTGSIDLDDLIHNRTLKEKEKETNVIFQPGGIGIDYREDEVMDVKAGSQAEEAGVAKGWKLRRVNGIQCTFFGDDLLIAAAQANVPFELTFAIDIQDEANRGGTSDSLSPALIEVAREQCFTPSCNSDFTEEDEEKELVGVPMESHQTPLDICIATPPAQDLQDVLEETKDVTSACEHENINNVNLPRQATDFKKLNDQKQAGVATVLDRGMLKMAVPKTRTQKEVLSVALAAATKNEEEGKELLAELGAKISSKEQELERKLAMAESMVRQIQEREIDKELGLIEDEYESKLVGQSFSSCGSPLLLTGSWFGSTSFLESAPQDKHRPFWRRWFDTSSTIAPF